MPKKKEILPQLREKCPTCDGDGVVCGKCGLRANLCMCYLKENVGWAPVECLNCNRKGFV